MFVDPDGSLTQFSGSEVNINLAYQDLSTSYPSFTFSKDDKGFVSIVSQMIGAVNAEEGKLADAITDPSILVKVNVDNDGWLMPNYPINGGTYNGNHRDL